MSPCVEDMIPSIGDPKDRLPDTHSRPPPTHTPRSNLTKEMKDLYDGNLKTLKK